VDNQRDHAMTPGALAAPLVSVVVPVRDNPDGIRALLTCLDAQTLPRDRFEVVIGDDGSRVGSIGQFATPDDRVRVVTEPPRTSYAARNQAAAVARGDVLAFTDSDCLPHARWLEEGLTALEGADIVAGHVSFVAPARPTLWSVLTVDMYLDQQRNVQRSRAATANLLVRRESFERWGRFDPSLISGGDYEFVLRAVARGARLVYGSGAAVSHATIDRPGPFLHKVWRTNRWAGIRRTRAGYRVGLRNALSFVPVLGVALARQDALRPVRRLASSRFREAGVTVTAWHEARALVVLYTLVGYVASFARLCGWLTASRASRAGALESEEVPVDEMKARGHRA
jgi:glycosyltransferase involved in cell wall biosynthesis